MTPNDEAETTAAPPNPLTPEPPAPTPTPGPRPHPRWTRPTLIVLAATAAITYTWGIGHFALELYYEAAVRSMGSSWHDSFYGAFDPAGTMSVDKLPGALWVQALSVRIFGFHTWAIALPQAVEGTATVLLIYRAVSRVSTPTAGLIAAAVMVATPATIGLNRGNISDSLLIFLLTAGADATTAALTSRRPTARLGAAGLFVGLAFQAKMLQAWFFLPSLTLVWLLAGPTRLTKRVTQIAAAGAIAVVVSLSWMTVVSVMPAAQRPTVDGSTHNSLFQQVFVYNGFSRVDQSEPGTGLSSRTFAALGDFRLPGGDGLQRLLTGAGGRDIGWLVPLALVCLVFLLVRRRGRPRTDPARAAAVLWGTWLLLTAAAFALAAGINAYYLAALTPAVAALCGLATAELMPMLARLDHRRLVSLGLAVVGTVVYSAWLLSPAPLAVRVVLPTVAFALAATALALPRARPTARPTASRVASRVAPLSVAALVAAVVALPLAASVDVVTAGLGPFDSPFQPAAVTDVTQTQPQQILTSLASGLKLLEKVNAKDRYLAATYTSILAVPLIIETGREIEPIGGFTGSTPTPTVAQLQHQVASGELSTVITPDVPDRRVSWIRRHCLPVPAPKGTNGKSALLPGIDIYFCPASRA